MASQELLHSGLFQRAVAHPDLTDLDDAARKAAKQTLKAKRYWEEIGGVDQVTLDQAYRRDLKRGPDHKLYRRGSNFTFPETPRVKASQAGHWMNLLERAPRKARGVKPSGVARYPITSSTLIVAHELMERAQRTGTVQVSAKELAAFLRPRQRAIKYALAALRHRGFVERHLVVTRRMGRLQMHCFQTANAYVLRLPTGTPLWRYPGG